jgi:hypothetical protein
MATCYAITEGEHSDYRVLAVFSTKELAKSELAKYGKSVEIEELPLDPRVPDAPAGMKGFCCCKGISNDIWTSSLSTHEMTKYKDVGEVQCSPNRTCYSVILWARDKDHAIKIAAEKFARQKAIDAGIAC